MDAVRRCLDARRLHYVQLDETTIRCGWDAIPRDYAICFRTMPPPAPGVSPRLMLHGAPDIAVRLERIPEARLLLHAINDTRLMGAWVLADDGTTNCRLGHLIPEGAPVGVGHLMDVVASEVLRAATPLLAVSEDGASAADTMLFLMEDA